MNLPLENKVAVVTGGTSGIGFAIAKQFVAAGAHVVLTGIDRAEIDRAVADVGESCTGFLANSSVLTDMEALYEGVRHRHGHLDAVVANAGIGDHAPLGKITEEQFDRTFGTNTKGVLFTVQPALPLMSGGGTVVVLGSTATMSPPQGMSMYGGAKAAARAFIRSWIQDAKGSGIRFNMLSPGAVDTDSLRAALTKAHGADKLDADLKQMGEGNPLGRVGQPDEIAAAVLFLCCDASSFITGIELFADGGMAQV